MPSDITSQNSSYERTTGSVSTSTHVFAVGYFFILAETEWLKLKVGTSGNPSGGSLSAPVAKTSMSFAPILESASAHAAQVQQVHSLQ